MAETTEEVHKRFEPHPNPQNLTGHESKSVDYESHPENSLKISAEHQEIVRAITALYSGSSNEKDMNVYAEKAIYDDPLSYCDTRYKIAGQWVSWERDSLQSLPRLCHVLMNLLSMDCPRYSAS
jgi:hypothetical protein